MAVQQPMLATKVTKETIGRLRYPLLVSPKIDGVRMIVKNGTGISRKWKPLANVKLQEWVSLHDELEGMDGEIVYGAMTDPLVFKNTQSATSTIKGPTPVSNAAYVVFDNIREHFAPYQSRYNEVKRIIGDPGIVAMVLEQYEVRNLEELMFYEEQFVALGFEGIMLRSLDSPYKFGRSTFNEHYLLKLKRFEDTEAEIIGVEELMHNDNEQTTDAFGRSKRSSHQENLKPGGKLGSLMCRSPSFAADFSVGTGFTDLDRKNIWQMHLRGELLGLTITYTYQPCGTDARPRFPSFKGFRHD